MTAERSRHQPPSRDDAAIAVAGAALLAAADIAATAALYPRLPDTIAVHWTATGLADRADGRSLAWALPVLIALIAALGAAARRHTNPPQRPALAAAVALSALYLFAASLHMLLANADNQTWQQGSVGTKWMLATLTAPAAVLAAAAATRHRHRHRHNQKHSPP